MKPIKEIDKIMQRIPKGWRHNWCGGENGPCACMGCVQIGNRMIMWEKTHNEKFQGDPEYIIEAAIPEDIYNKYKITKPEWELWENLIKVTDVVILYSFLCPKCNEEKIMFEDEKIEYKCSCGAELIIKPDQ